MTHKLAIPCVAIAAGALMGCGDDTDGRTSGISPSEGQSRQFQEPRKTVGSKRIKTPSKSAPSVRLEMSKNEITRLPPITIRKRNGPPPGALRVVDLRDGFGARLRRGDTRFVVNYYSVRYGEALKKARRGRFGPTPFGLDTVVDSWKIGLPGMKVGGRRELVAPERLTYPGGGALIYVVDLLEIDQGLPGR